MENIKEELKKVIVDVMLPETQAYLDEINKNIENKTVNEEDLEAKGDIESFINELKAILEVVEENKLSDDDARNVYEKIITMLDEHEED